LLQSYLSLNPKALSNRQFQSVDFSGILLSKQKFKAHESVKLLPDKDLADFALISRAIA
jgi:hypothetical protein